MDVGERIEDARRQSVEVGRSLLELGWAIGVLGAGQVAQLLGASPGGGREERLASTLDGIADAVEGELGETFRDAFRIGSAFATAPLDGLAGFELHRAMQALAMRPLAFAPMKAALPPLVAAASAMIPGRDADLARAECEAKLDVIEWVQDVRELCPHRDVHVPLAEIVAKGYALGPFPALWAVEGIGHELVASRRHRGEPLGELLVSDEVGELPDASLTMLHAGIGLGLAELALDDLRPDSPREAFDAALARFVADCRSSSRPGYVGCALESLGLVARHLSGPLMVTAVDRSLTGGEEALRDHFWHGVGRALYFSPDNMLPGLASPWPAVALCDRQAPDGRARQNLVAGFAWGLTMVNLRQPAVLEAFLAGHPGFADSEAFANGVAASLIMRRDTTPDEPAVADLLAHRPAAEPPGLPALWDRVIRQPVTRALETQHAALAARGRLGEIFRFQSLDALVS